MNGHLFIKIMQIFLLILSLQVISVELCGLVDYSPKYCLHPDDSSCYERIYWNKIQKCNDTASSCVNKGQFCVPSKIEHVRMEHFLDSDSSMVRWIDEYEAKGCVCAKKKNPIHIWDVKGQDSPVTKCFKFYKMMAMSTFTLTAVCIVFIIIIIFLCVHYQTCKKCRSNRKTDQQNGDNSTENDQKTDV